MAALPKKVPDTIYLKYSTICHLFEIQYNFKIMNKTTPNNAAGRGLLMSGLNPLKREAIKKVQTALLEQVLNFPEKVKIFFSINA